MTITISQTIDTDTTLTIGDNNNKLIFNANKIIIYEILDPDPGSYYELIKSDTGTVIEKKEYNLNPTTTTNNNITITNNKIYTADNKYLQIGNDSYNLTINNFVLYLKDNNGENGDFYQVNEFVESITIFNTTNLSSTNSITIDADTITSTDSEKKWYIGSDSDTNNISVILKGNIINFNSFKASTIPIYSSGDGGDGGDGGDSGGGDSGDGEGYVPPGMP